LSRIQLAAIFMVAGLTGLSGAAPLRAQEDPVRLGLVSFVGEATNLFALETGLFEANGLNVEVVRNQAGVESLLGVMSGELDIATVAITPVVYAAMGRLGPGREFEVVASILNSSRLNQVVAAVGSGIEVPSDISAKRVGVTLGTASEFLWDLFALAHGIEDVEILDVPVNRKRRPRPIDYEDF
jgi:NitT/TauT family transport system substrate-binding protein